MVQPTVQKFLDQFPQVFPHNAAMGMRLEIEAAGQIQMHLPPRPAFQPHASMPFFHTSTLVTLLDSATGCCALSALKTMMPLATLDLHVDYLKPSTIEHPVVASAECYKLTENVAFVRASAWQQTPDNIVAHANASFMLGTYAVAPAKKPANTNEAES